MKSNDNQANNTMNETLDGKTGSKKTLDGTGTQNMMGTQNTKNLLTKRQSKPAYLQSLNESEK